MSQESRTPRIHIKRRVELSSLQNEPSSTHNEPESSETSKKNVNISSLKEKYNIRLPRSYKEQISAPQTVHFSEELESTIPEIVDELKTENQKLKKEIAKLKRQNSQMEIDFEEKLEKSQKNINQMKEEIDFLANINQQFESISVRSSPGDSDTELEIIPSKRKRVFDNDSENDTESDDEKNEKDTRNEIKTIIKTIDSEFSLYYNQTFTSANNYEICCKLIPELQKSLTPKFKPSITQLTKWLNTTARMRNSGKLLKDLRRVHANNRQNDKKFQSISVRSSPGDSDTELEIIPSKRKRVFDNDSENDTESDDEKNEKDTRNEIKTIIKTIDSEFSLYYNQTFTSANNYEICCKLIPELQKSLTPKFKPSITQLTKWLNTTARMRNSGKLLKDLRRVHANNRQNDKKLRCIKAAKELFRKNNPNITNYDKESLL
ncbi:hypothetical protein Glove_149g70 [Diversispora epigaea]|uniref:Uncharacterized protein n=1 Tax=Diversispora epigaea TaxID=1348612 RepID=A0A397J2M9_9GLOM|nr:hypothetical protein Glove_149g70 [Diversispora epigaea]